LDVELCPEVDEYFLGNYHRRRRGERGTEEPKFNRRKGWIKGNNM